MHVSETESSSPARRKPAMQISTVTAMPDVHEEIVRLFQEVYGAKPVSDPWSGDAVRERLFNVFDRSIHPVCRAYWGDGHIGKAGELIGLLTGFQMAPQDHWRVTGKKDISPAIDDAFGKAKHVGFVQDLLVPQQWRHKGIGRALFADAVSYFNGQHMTVVLTRALRDPKDPFLSSCLRTGWQRVMRLEDSAFLLLGRRFRDEPAEEEHAS